MAKKIALLIGVSEYGADIPPLSSALNDVEAMERVLKNPNLGNFTQVERLLNPTSEDMRKAILNLFKNKDKDDLILFFFSGHGITNDDNHLYLATHNTAKDDFEATAVDANFIQAQSKDCYSKRQVLILDACYSGAFASGWHTKSIGVDIKKELGAEGRVVLTSSGATQTSFAQEGATLSLYTQYLVEGIETGAADSDGDGNIHVQELHTYAKAKVQAVKPKMTPDIILDKEGYNILLAYAPKNPEADYRKLVEQYAKNGELNEFAFLVLKPKRKTLGITDTKAEEIETEVLEPFRKRLANLQSYKQAFAKAVEQKYPLDEHILNILKDYQQDVLGLRDEDVASIELEITSVKEAEYQKQLQIQKQQEKEEYENKLERYEQELAKAVQAQYPLNECVHNGLKQLQHFLQLRDEDVASIELKITSVKEAEYQKQIQIQRQKEKEQYENKLERYEQELTKAVQAQYPLDEYVCNGLRQFQHFLQLGDEDVESIKLKIISVKEVEYQKQLQIQKQQEVQELQRQRKQQVERNNSGYQLKTFQFKTAHINEKGTEIKFITKSAEYFTEDLGNGVFLEMVHIPGGTFIMGSPENEESRSSSESPQHEVTVPPFFMGKYLITQKQWRVVAALPKVKIDLKLDPSHFKGDNLPVESVSSNDVQEFCARLSQKTDKVYRLPSEAEWEYACRGGTTTPFYCGETISTDLANYRGTHWKVGNTFYPGNYGQGQRGEFRGKTTEIGKFPANPCGLYDMCGNVCELCQDKWHKNYTNAPNDGSAWLESKNNDLKLIRGGSWNHIPSICRSDHRNRADCDFRSNSIGFRVVCIDAARN